METPRKAREKKTPVKITVKAWQLNANKLLARIEKTRLSEDLQINPSVLKRQEILDKISEMPSADDVISIVDQMKAIKLKKTEEIYKRLEGLEQTIQEVESTIPKSQDEALAVLTKALRAGVQTLNIQSLLEEVTRSNDSAVLTMKHMQNFVEAKEDEIPPHILEILRSKESFVRDFMARYHTWFSQDLGIIMEQELEQALTDFRDMGIEVEPSTKVVALVHVRDLLIHIHQLIAERESAKEQFSIESILRLINKPSIQMLGEKELKELRTNLEAVQNSSNLLEITYPKFEKLITDLEGYIWRLEVKLFLSKTKTKPDQMYRLVRMCPDTRCDEEFQNLARRLKLPPLEEGEIQGYIDEFFSDKLSQVEARRFADKALIADIQDDLQFKLVRIANKILMNEGRLTEAIVRQLTELGLGGCKVVRRYMGKETAKKEEETGKSSLSRLRLDFPSEIANTEDADTESNEMKKEEIQSIEIKRDEATQTDNTLMAAEEIPQEVVSSHLPIEHFEIHVEVEFTRHEIPEEEEEKECVDVEVRMDTETLTPDSVEPKAQDLPRCEITVNLGPERSFKASPVRPVEVPVIEKSISDSEPMNEEPIDDASEKPLEPIQNEEPAPVSVEAELPAPARKSSIYTEVRQEESLTNEIQKPVAQKLPSVSLSYAQDCYISKIVPERFEGTYEDFDHAMGVISQALFKLSDPHVGLHDLHSTIHKLHHSQIEFPDIKILEKKYTRANAFKQKITEMLENPDELVAKKEELTAEHNTLGVDVPEFKRILEEIDRDAKTAKDVQDTLARQEHISLAEITHIKNRDQAARYFKDKNISLKIYDKFIMAFIAAWKAHDHENGETEIDYLTLKEVCGVVIFQDNGKIKYIKPENAEFIKKFYDKVRQYLSNEVYSRNLEELQKRNPSKTYKRFVDLTGRFIDHKYRLQEKASAENEADLNRKKALKPSGKKSLINKKIDYEHNPKTYNFSKPAFTNKILPVHRKFYVNSWKHYIDANPHLNVKPERAFQIAGDLERTIYEKNINKSAIMYENDCDVLLTIIKKLCSYKYLSRRSKSKMFDLDYLMKFKNMGVQELNNCNTKYRTMYQDYAKLKKRNEQKIQKEENKIAEHNQNAEPMKEEKLPKDKIENRNPKATQSCTIEYNYDIEVQPSALIKSNYQPMRLFEGSFVIGMPNKNNHQIGKVVLETFDSIENATRVTSIPQNTVLSTNLSFSGFKNYMNFTVLQRNKFKPNSYNLQQGWVANNEASKEMSSLINTFGCALSIEYSATCKIFIFPMKSVPSFWLEKKEFWVESPSTELIYLIVIKASNSNVEKKISPVKLDPSAYSFYKLYAKSHVLEREVYQAENQQPMRKYYKPDYQPHQQEEKYDNRDRERQPRHNHQQSMEDYIARKNYNSVFQRASKMVMSQEEFDYNPHKNTIFEDVLRDDTLGKRTLQDLEVLRDYSNNSSQDNKNYDKQRQMKEGRRNNFARLLNDMTLQTSKRNNQDPSQVQPVDSTTKEKEYRHKLISYLNKPANKTHNENQPEEEKSSLKTLIPPPQQEHFSRDDENETLRDTTFTNFGQQTSCIRRAIDLIRAQPLVTENNRLGTAQEGFHELY